MASSFQWRLVAIIVFVPFFLFTPVARAAPPTPTQSFVGNHGGTYYDFSLWHTSATGMNSAGVVNTTDMPWLGQGAVAGSWSDLARSYYSASNGMNAGWATGNGSLPVYAINRFNSPLAFSTVYYGINGSYSSSLLASGATNWYMTATVVTGGATPLNNPGLNGFILDSPSLTYSAGAGAAPEIDGSLAPKVGLLLCCLYFLFGRKKQNAEPQMIA